MSGQSTSESLQQMRAQISSLLDRADQSTPVSASSVFRVALAKDSRFASSVDALAAAANRQSGLRAFRHRQRAADRNSIEYTIDEDWESASAFRTYWNSSDVRQFQQQAEGLVVSSPQINIHTNTPGASVPGLPRTGQEGAWDVSGNPIPVQGTGQDGESRAGIPLPSPRFQDNRDGTVTDRLTNLTWLKDADSFGEIPWMQAMQAARSLANGSHGLKDGSCPGDWRAPNIRELFSLIDFSAHDPIITPNHPFDGVRSAIYWTSTSLTPAPHITWMMTLGIGPTVFDLKTSSNRLWPVKGKQSRVPKTGQAGCWDAHGAPLGSCQGSGQDGELQAGAAPPTPRFADNNDGTVTDNMTGLVWLKNANPFGLRTWAQGLALCNSLESGVYGLTDGSHAGDWRMPNIREAESVVDYGQVGPCLPQGHPFIGVRPSSYWTSTSVTIAPSEAMFIIYGVGPAIFESKEHPFFVWPVRNPRP